MALFKNKDTDKKRKGENVIGKIIYGFLLFAPLLSIMFTSLYTVFNKNAYESYSGSTEVITNVDIDYKYQTNEVNSINDLVVGNIYHFDYTGSRLTEDSNDYYIYGSNLFNVNTTATFNYISAAKSNDEHPFLFGWQNSSSQNRFLFRSLCFVNDFPYVFLFGISQDNFNISFDFIFYSINESTFTVFKDYISSSTFNVVEGVTTETSEVTYLDNAFEYGMYKTEQSNIYNWSKSTGTYTVLQNVCTGIGINNTFVPMLMAYWLLISIIYFLFDIALILIWAVHDKIHALKDAI